MSLRDKQHVGGVSLSAGNLHGKCDRSVSSSGMWGPPGNCAQASSRSFLPRPHHAECGCRDNQAMATVTPRPGLHQPVLSALQGCAVPGRWLAGWPSHSRHRSRWASPVRHKAQTLKISIFLQPWGPLAGRDLRECPAPSVSEPCMLAAPMQKGPCPSWDSGPADQDTKALGTAFSSQSMPSQPSPPGVRPLCPSAPTHLPGLLVYSLWSEPGSEKEGAGGGNPLSLPLGGGAGAWMLLDRHRMLCRVPEASQKGVLCSEPSSQGSREGSGRQCGHLGGNNTLPQEAELLGEPLSCSGRGLAAHQWAWQQSCFISRYQFSHFRNRFLAKPF